MRHQGKISPNTARQVRGGRSLNTRSLPKKAKKRESRLNIDRSLVRIHLPQVLRRALRAQVIRSLLPKKWSRLPCLLVAQLLAAKCLIQIWQTKYRILLSPLQLTLPFRAYLSRKSNDPRNACTISSRSSGEKVDSFLKKFLRRKGANFNTALDRRHLNLAGRILDPLGPLAGLWQIGLSAEADNTGVDPSLVIDFVRRTMSLVGNASHCALTDRRKTLLAKFGGMFGSG